MNITRRGHTESGKLLEKGYASLEAALSFLVTSSVFVAVALFAVVYFSFRLIAVQPHLLLIFGLSLVTFSIYNVNKITDKEEDKVNTPDRANLIGKREHVVLALSVIAYAAALIIGVFSGKRLVVLSYLLPLISGVMYSLPMLPNGVRLKDVLFAKNIVIAASIALSTILLLLVSYGRWMPVTLLVCFLFIKLFINTVLFDVRDVVGDSQQGIRTLPVALGVRRTKILLLGMNTLLLPLAAVMFISAGFNALLPVVLFSVCYGYYYIHYFCRPATDFSLRYDLVLDGEWIMLSGLAFVATGIL